MTSPSTAATLKARLTNDAQWLERLGDCYHADSLTQRNYRAVAANVREAAERTESAERQLAEATLKLRLYENGTSPNQPLVDDIERWRVESEQAIAEAAAKLEKVRRFGWKMGEGMVVMKDGPFVLYQEAMASVSPPPSQETREPEHEDPDTRVDRP